MPCTFSVSGFATNYHRHCEEFLGCNLGGCGTVFSNRWYSSFSVPVGFYNAKKAEKAGWKVTSFLCGSKLEKDGATFEVSGQAGSKERTITVVVPSKTHPLFPKMVKMHRELSGIPAVTTHAIREFPADVDDQLKDENQRLKEENIKLREQYANAKAKADGRREEELRQMQASGVT